MHFLDSKRPSGQEERFTMHRPRMRVASFLALCWLMTGASGLAQEGKIEAVQGPSEIKLGDNLAVLKLPKDEVFITAKSAKEILKRQGNSPEGVLGIVAPEDKDAHWIVIAIFDDCGYVTDDDAGKLNADEILKSYKEGTKEQNDQRKEQGVPPIYVGGWAEKPRYQKDKHSVIWAIQVKEQESADAPITSINYNTRVLGRKGVLSMNLVTDPDKLDADKPNVLALLNDTNFVKGQSYADYVPGKDKSAGYGIAGLILGGGALAAAAKFGLLGAAWKWILALVIMMKKFIIVIVAGIGAFFAKIFKKNKSQDV